MSEIANEELIRKRHNVSLVMEKYYDVLVNGTHNKYTTGLAIQPEHYPVKLMEHQLVLLQGMLSLEKDRVSMRYYENELIFYRMQLGVLLEEAGSGKTNVILSLIHAVPRLSETSKHFNIRELIHHRRLELSYVHLKYTNIDRSLPKRGGPNLIIVPSHLIHKWISAIEESELTYTYATTSSDFILKNQDIILISDVSLYKMEDFQHFELFSRLIFDENTYDTIPAEIYKSISACFTWIISNNGERILNPIRYSKHKNEIDKTLYALNKIGNGHIIRNKLEHTLQSMNLSEPENRQFWVINPSLYSNSSQFPPFIIEKALQKYENKDYKNAASMMGYSIATSPSEKEFIHYLLYKYQQEHVIEISKIELLKNRLTPSSDCSICFSDIKDAPIYTPCCYTKVCMECIFTWQKINYKCPYCRNDLIEQGQKMIMVDINPTISVTSVIEGHTILYKNRVSVLRTILATILHTESEVGSRIIIYGSRYSKYGIKTICRELNLNLRERLGGEKTIKTMIRVWNNTSISEPRGLLIHRMDSESMISGLDLTGTSDIIFFDSPETEYEKHQIISRVNRIGYKGSLKVYNITGSYENRLY